MNMEAITTAAPTITLHPLQNLILSPLNPRQSVTEEEIAALAASIRACGLIQNLAGIETPEGVAIVAGGRRLRALHLLATQGQAPDFIPVRLAKDEAEARAWAVAENTARADLDPADEILAYGQMASAGATIADIASAFAVTEAHVRRRLRLADLPTEVLGALKARTINLSHAEAFTLCNDGEKIPEALARVASHNWTANNLTSFFTNDTVANTDRRAVFVTLDAYKAAGGSVTADLFSSREYLNNVALLDKLFTAKLAASADALLDEGWKWTETLSEYYVPYGITERLKRLLPQRGQLSGEEAIEYDELSELSEADAINEEGAARLNALDQQMKPHYTEAQIAHVGGYVYVNNSGELRTEMGYLRNEDHAAAAEAGLITAPQTLDPAHATPKSPYSQALLTDMKAARLAALQQALLSKPELALDLLAYTIDLRRSYPGEALALRTSPPNIAPTIMDGIEIDPRLTPEHESVGNNAEGFMAFQAQGKKTRNAVLTAAIARQVTYGCSSYRVSTLFDHIEEESGASLRRVWTPTAENFFARVGGPYLDALYADLLSIEATDEKARAFAKLKKGAKAETMERIFCDPATQKLHGLNADQTARLATWVPDCF